MELVSCFVNWIYFLFWSLILLGNGNFTLIYLGFHVPFFGVVSILPRLTCMSRESGAWCCQLSMLASDETSLFLSGPCPWSTQVPADVAFLTNSWQPGHMASCLAGQAEIRKDSSLPPLGTWDYFAASEREGNCRWHFREHLEKTQRKRCCI